MRRQGGVLPTASSDRYEKSKRLPSHRIWLRTTVLWCRRNLRLVICAAALCLCIAVALIVVLVGAPSDGVAQNFLRGRPENDAVSPSIDIAKYVEGLSPVDLKSPVPLAANVSLPEESDSAEGIPNVVHFVFGMKKDMGGHPFSLVHYLSVRSAAINMKPKAIYFYYAYEPTGLYWDLIKHVLTLVHVKPVHTVFGREVKHYAHMADVIRLRALLKHGGIYLDLDVIALKPFDSVLNSGADFVMGQEGENGRIGLCNAVIIAKKSSKFLKQWYQAYKTFDESAWNYHSVLLPGKMAKANPDLIKIVGYKTFFWPLWDKGGLQDLFVDNSYSFADNLAVHLWSSSNASHWLNTMNMGSILYSEAAYHTILRPLLPYPWISVVMPCYNQTKYIEEAIQSVLDQSFPLWEIILVDDRSPDKCADFVENNLVPKYPRLQAPGAIRFIRNNVNLGLAGSRNAAVSAATGAWICALDADDKIGPSYFASAQKMLTRNPALTFMYSDQQFAEEDFTYGFKSLWEVPRYTPQAATANGPFPVMSLYAKQHWVDAGGYLTVLPWGNEDWDFWLRLTRHGIASAKLADDVHTMYRYKRNSMMRTKELYPECVGMLFTMHSDMLTSDTLLSSHYIVINMKAKTLATLYGYIKNPVSRQDAMIGFVYMWIGMSIEGKLVHYTRTKKAGVGKEEDANELISSAKMWYNKALVAASGKLSTSSVGLQSSELLWQVKWRMGQLLCNFGTAGEQQQAKDDLNSAISLNARLAVHNEVKRLVDKCLGHVLDDSRALPYPVDDPAFDFADAGPSADSNVGRTAQHSSGR